VIRIVGPLILLGLQYLVYRKTRGLLKEAGASRNVIRFVAGMFIVINSLALGVMLSSTLLLELPLWVRYATLYPLFIWQGSTFFLALIILVGSIIT
jgi:hypothetical protein